jgi:hypothetical protein
LFGRAVIIYQVKSDARKDGEVQHELQMLANPMISGSYEKAYHHAIPSKCQSS